MSDKSKVVSTLANSLYGCYSSFLKGDANLFSGTGNFCFICSSIQLEGMAETEIQGFYKYLLEKKVLYSTRNYATEFGIAEQAHEAQNVNLPNKDYLVLFYHDRQPDPVTFRLPLTEGLVINKRRADVRSSFILVPQDHELLQQIQCTPVRPCESI